ncbi:FHIPEP family type III secretion protein [Mesorhizobium calcicola]|uniref:FHIPEP family type III secretion protein n=1 Tax=Mesorhizobium calcicola TaxID=1300310 RepID=A0ABW4W946_9HYPH
MGLVIFLIITVAQFIVVARGAERVAEVAARFTLDALPGKQMSIDAELRNGDIDHAEARRLRQQLERESQLFGAMDGAMKFVKGDVIAGIVIILVKPCRWFRRRNAAARYVPGGRGCHLLAADRG